MTMANSLRTAIHAPEPQRDDDGHHAQAGASSAGFQGAQRYRDLLWILGLRDLKVRYKQTIIGAAW